jgi:hypothetical protein
VECGLLRYIHGLKHWAESFLWAIIVFGGPWSLHGEEFSPAPAPVMFRGSAPLPPRGDFAPRPR